MKRLATKTSIPFLFLISSIFPGFGCSKPAPSPDNPKSYIQAMVEAIGGVDRLHALKDVEYQYTYRTGEKEDVSLERYVFDGELSWGKFSKRENIMLPDLEGELIHRRVAALHQLASEPAERPAGAAPLAPHETIEQVEQLAQDHAVIIQKVVHSSL